MNERAIFFMALDKTPAERGAYLDTACAGDTVLRRRIETLLQSHLALGDFLETPAAQQLEGKGDAPPRQLADSVPLDFLSPSSRSDSLGRLGHYEVLEVLGKGGMGLVLRAFDETLQRVVAIKTLAPSLASTGSARQRFVREARAAAAVTHDHVIAIHAVEESGPAPYLVMQYISGPTLQDKLDRCGPLPIREIVRVGMQIAEGLAAAHRHGLVHRDVKPANILLENGVERVKLTDFGLARAADDASMTQSGVIAGTPAYMSPEQANGEHVDFRSDLFSLGSVLYALCAGHAPFRASTTMAVLKRVCDNRPRDLREVNPDVPDWLIALISKLHAKKPEERFGSAREVADVLASALGGTTPNVPVAAVDKPVPAVRASAPRTAKSRWLAAAAACVLLVAGLGLTEAAGVTDIRSTVIRLISPDGTLVIEVDDPAISVAIDGADVVITGTGVRELRLKPGTYKVQGSKEGKLVQQELVSVSRAGKQVVRIGKEPAEPTSTESDAAWEKYVATLPAAAQVNAVLRQMRGRNPGFHGPLNPVIRDDVVTGVRFSTDLVSDLSPLRVLKRLELLECCGSSDNSGKVADLSPLRGLPLKRLVLSQNQVLELSPLSGMPLEFLGFRRNLAVKDLRPLKGLPLRYLDCGHTCVNDLTPLKGMKLTQLRCDQSLVSDVTPLAGMDLKELFLAYTQVSNLTPLRGTPLETLLLQGSRVTDLTPLRGMPLHRLEMSNECDLTPLRGLPLTSLTLNFRREHDSEIVRSLTTLQFINGKPATDFWKEVEGK